LKKKAITLELIIALAFTLIFYGILPRTVESQSLGTIYIRADGNVEGTDKIQRNGNIYVLKGSISGPIIVERDTIVLDGAGYTLQGSNGRESLKAATAFYWTTPQIAPSETTL
jgi:hypothetical protein